MSASILERWNDRIRDLDDQNRQLAAERHVLQRKIYDAKKQLNCGTYRLTPDRKQQ